MTQEYENKRCKEAHEFVIDALKNYSVTNISRLRTCNAHVYTWDFGDNFMAYALKSYETFVALVLSADGVKYSCYDFLRYAHGYTATSSQHISKFFADYAPQDSIRYRYYPTKEAYIIFHERR